MEQMSQHQEFRHDPLPDSTSHIRLLEILEGDPGKRVVCQLSSWLIETAPSYYAISYTWGEPRPTSLIIINGRHTEVGNNCEYVMRQAYNSGASKYFWIDALCIDQASKQEKTHQVALMGRLYERASHVFACVGEHADGSEFLVRTIDKHSRLLSRIHQHIVDSGHRSSKLWTIENPIPMGRRLSVQCFFAMDAGTRHRLAEAVISFMRRSYFSRVWVLQELQLASTTSFCCGMDIRSFDYLIGITMLVDFWINAQEYVAYWHPITRLAVSLLSTQPWILRRLKVCRDMCAALLEVAPQRGCLALASGVRGTRRLSEVLDNMQYFSCADARDKLYGILALVDWPGQSKPDPDYSNDCFQVAIAIYNIYWTHPTCAPVTGSVVEWVGRLRETFGISLDQSTLHKAAALRYPDSQLPTVMLNRRGSIQSVSSTHRQSIGGVSITTLRSLQLRKRLPKNRSKNTWYGIKLQHARNIRQYSASRYSSVKFLCLEERPGEATNRIYDQDGNFFAFAPKGTRASNWLLTSDNRQYTASDVLALVVKFPETNSGQYRIIGQASICYENLESIIPLLEWEDFSATWSSPEDLFVLEWSHYNRTCGDLSSNEITQWLRLRVCATEESSYFQGPSLEPIEDSDSPYLPYWIKRRGSHTRFIDTADDDVFVETFAVSADELLPEDIF